MIGGEQRNVADFQIATSMSLLLTMEDVRPYLEVRPAEDHANAVVTDSAVTCRGHFPWIGCRPSPPEPESGRFRPFRQVVPLPCD